MDLKSKSKRTLQFILGKSYLYFFAIYRLIMFRIDSKEKQFKGFLKTINPDSNILDVGANIGIITYFFSRRVKSGKVFSFEPIPANYKVLSAIIKFFRIKNVLKFQIALGNENKEVAMVIPEESGVKRFGLEHIIAQDITWLNEGKKHSVQMKKLDDLDELRKIKIDIIKMDVENYEFEALKGAKELIMKNKPLIILELWENENRTNTINYLESLGYKTNVLIGNVFVEYSQEKHESQDFFFIPS